MLTSHIYEVGLEAGVQTSKVMLRQSYDTGSGRTGFVRDTFDYKHSYYPQSRILAILSADAVYKLEA